MKEKEIEYAFSSSIQNPHDPTDYDYNKGMTLRDYFASKALQGLWSSHANNGAASPIHGDMALYAESCYKMADAMLKARET